jgi:Fe-S cluster assembly protein SufD
MFKLLNQSLNENPVLTNSVTLLKKRAIVDYYKIQNDNLTANLIDNTYVSQKTRKQRCSEYFSWRKPNQKQLEFLPFWRKNSKLLERNYNYWREAARRPLYVGTACYSKLWKSSRLRNLFWPFDRCFQRKIYVEKEAQKTNAFQKHNILLMTKRL